MDLTTVNWEALDSLVIDFAKTENLLEEPSSTSSSPTSPTSSSSSYRSRLLLRQIRRFLELGDVDRAMALLTLHAPEVLGDRRLLFRLQKQKFIELLRKGSDEDRDLAIRCLREDLAPVALDAYPEAYEDFKHILLALIFDKDDRTSPVANEWSEKRRSDLAGLLCSVLRAHLRAYDPIFAMSLRYLISIHKIFCSRQGIPSPISDLTQRLLFEDRDPQGTAQESMYELPPFDEVDIQALAHAVELTRQGAIDSLRFARGNLSEAFQNELCRMKMNLAVLDELVHEYCVYRGFVDNSHISPSDCGTSRLSDGEASVGNIDVEVDQADSAKKQASESDMRFLHDFASSNEDCSTSDATLSENYCRRYRRNRSHATTNFNKRKRWRGRDPEVPIDAVLRESNKKEGVHSTPGGYGEADNEMMSSLSSLEHVDDHKYGVILEMRELAYKGMVTEVVEELNAMDPDFFSQNPTLLFQLKQFEFLKLIGDGNHSEALKVASTYLGPLATSNPDLLKSLKETLFSFIRPNEDTPVGGIPLTVLATSLQVAMGGRLGIEEPHLMKIMRATIYTHNEWFKLQMCKDRFEGLLKIDSLKEIAFPVLSESSCKVYSDAGTHTQDPVSSGGKVPGGTSPASVSSGDVGYDEGAILKVMEFLAMPRADAIELLAQCNGNAEAAIQHIFA